MKTWMMETDGLKELNPEKMVSHNVPVEKAGTVIQREA